MRAQAAIAHAVLLALFVPARAAEPAKDAAPAPPAPQAPAAPAPADVKKTLYGVGLAISKSLEVFALTPAELEAVLGGVRDGWAQKPKAQLDAKMQQSMNELARARAPKAAAKAAAREKAAGAPYVARMAKEKGAARTPSGAIVIPIVVGTGESPKETDKVKVAYTGTLVDGQVFDSSAGRGPTEFPLNGVIKCWSEGVRTMKVGGKAKLVCPPDVAYGETGSPPAVPGNAVLTFEVELLGIAK